MINAKKSIINAILRYLYSISQHYEHHLWIFCNMDPFYMIQAHEAPNTYPKRYT